MAGAVSLNYIVMKYLLKFAFGISLILSACFSYAISPDARNLLSPTDSLETLDASGIEDTKATLNGKVYALTAGNTIVTIQFVYWKDGAGSTSFADALAFTTVSGTAFSANVSGLSAYSDYYYYCRGALVVPGEDPVYIYGDTIEFSTSDVWDGSTDHDWDDGTNWGSGSVPSSTSNVVIPSSYTNYPTVNVTSSINSVILRSGADLEVESRKTFTIDGDLLLEASSTSHSTIKLNSRSNISVSGSTKVETYLAQDEWHFISMPITSASMASAFYQNEDPKIYVVWYDETYPYSGSGLCEDCWTYVNDGTMAINIMEGYSAWAADKSTIITWDGTLNTSTSSSFSVSTAPDGWNIVGNPYPCNIDWVEVYDVNTNIEDKFYIWMGGSGNYGSYSAGVTSGLDGSIIPSTQAFFLRTTTNQSVTIPRSAQVISDQSYYKSTRENIINQINIRIDGERYWDEMAVVFKDGAEAGYDDMDAEKFWGMDAAPQLYCVLDDDKWLSINALPDPGSDWSFRIPFTTYLWHDKEYTFSTRRSESLPDNVKVELYDKFNDKYTALSYGESYTFEADSGFYNDRFELVFSDATSIDEYSPNISDIKVFYSSKTGINISIVGQAGNLTGIYSVYDMQGKKLVNGDLVFSDASETVQVPFNMNISNAYYVVVVNLGNKVFAKKLYVN